MIVFDHTDNRWRKRYVRINGAETYSKDIMKYQLDNWKKVLGKEDILSTCPRLSGVASGRRCRVAVQYLHEFPYADPIGYARKSIRGIQARLTVFVTAYREYQRLLTAAGLKAVFVPMSIDVSAVQKHREAFRYSDRYIYFGNVDARKRKTYRLIHKLISRRMDTLTRATFQGEQVSQTQAWNVLSRYAFGIGVGRCALEMFALGLKVFIAGRVVGGVIRNEDDWQAQIGTNFNGRVVTYSRNVNQCLLALPKSYVGEIPDIRTMDHAEMYTAAGYA